MSGIRDSLLMFGAGVLPGLELVFLLYSLHFLNLLSLDFRIG